MTTPANDNFRHGVRYVVEPRLVPMTKAARRLHLTLAEFKSHLPALRRDGFPTACAITGHFDLKAIDAWLDKRTGVADTNEISDHELEALLEEALSKVG